jgi:hypothetical protein
MHHAHPPPNGRPHATTIANRYTRIILYNFKYAFKDVSMMRCLHPLKHHLCLIFLPNIYQPKPPGYSGIKLVVNPSSRRKEGVSQDCYFSLSCPASGSALFQMENGRLSGALIAVCVLGK